jgi:microcompartment protein CcmL/EutN
MALGVLEVRGMVTLAAAVDVMLKTASVQLTGRHGIGSGWLTVTIEGEVAAVDAAIRAGEVSSRQHGEMITAHVIPRPDTDAVAQMPHTKLTVRAATVHGALGVLETKGLAQLVGGTDAMVKAAAVELVGWAHIGGALCHAMVRGETSAVETAVEAGVRVAGSVGQVHASLVLPQPDDGLRALMPTEATGVATETGALGVVETTGYVGAVAATDAMVKTADVEICSLSIASGGRVAVFATGRLESVKASVEEAAVASRAAAELDAVCVVSRPDPHVLSCFAGRAEGRTAKLGTAMGLIETKTTVGLVKAVDEMLKAADVTYEGKHKVGNFLTAAVVRGDVEAVRAALDVGSQEATAIGELVSAHEIAYPYAELQERLPHR